MRWRIELLGGLSARRGDRVESKFATRMTAELLAFLATQLGVGIARDRLGRILWPETEDVEAVRIRLRQAIASLRRQLEPPEIEAGSVIVADREQISISAAAVETDVADFELLVSQARRSSPERAERSLEKALSLYRGPFLNGFTSDWVAQRQVALETEFLEAADRLADIKLARGALEGAASILKRACEIEPYDEERHIKLIKTFAAHGRREEALQTFEAFRDRLQGDLKETVSNELQRLGNSLRKAATGSKPTVTPDHQEAVPAKRMRRFPVPPTRFFGREAEIAWLRNLLEDDTTRMITLVGTGGAGKTRLALEVAEALFGAGHDEVWFVPLADITEARSILEATTDALRLPKAAEGDSVKLIADELTNFDSPVIVFDNFEHLVEDGATLVGELIERVPSLKVLATSRQSLALAGEQVFPVGLLPVPESLDASPRELLAISSVQLFADRAKMARADFQITPRNAATVAELVQRLEGIPLAIELCAALALTVSPSQMLLGLRKRFELLVSRRRDISSRHRTLRTAIEFSYQRLDPKLSRAFRRLSIFQGGWSRESAVAILGAEEAEGVLQDLQERSLIFGYEVSPSGEPEMRFRMLETLREFAWEALSSDEQEDVAREHQAIFRSLAKEAGERAARNEPTWYSWLDLEYSNLTATLRWCLAEDNLEAAFDLCNDLYRYWSYRGGILEGYRWFEEVLSHPRTESVNLAVRCLAAQNQSRLAGRLSDVGNMYRFGQRYLQLAEMLGDSNQIAIASNLLGCQRLYVADFEGGKFLLEQALEQAQRSSVPATVAMVTVNLATAHWTLHQENRAWEMYDEGIRLSRACGERGYICNAIVNLGGLAVSLGRYEDALTILVEGIALCEEIGFLLAKQGMLTELARLDVALGDHQGAAEALLEAALGGSHEEMVSALRCAAAVLFQAGSLHETATLCGAAQGLLEKFGFHPDLFERFGETPFLESTRKSLGKIVYQTYFLVGKQMSQSRAADFMDAALRGFLARQLADSGAILGSN